MTEPLDLWQRQRDTASSRDLDALGNAHIEMQYIGIDGRPHTASGQVRANWKRFALLSCCPCAVGGCSQDNQEQYRSMFASVSGVLVVVQLVMLIVAIALQGFAPFKKNPMIGPCPGALLDLGGFNAALTFGKVQLYRLFLPLLLHGGFLHLGMNALAELRLGLLVERRLGTVYVAYLYVLGTVGGNLMSGWLSPRATVSVGASSALMAIVGAFAAFVAVTWNETPPSVRKINGIQVAVWLGITFLFSLLPFVDFGAHLGGVLVGFPLGIMMNVRETSLTDATKRNLFLGSVAFLVVFFVVLTSLLSTGVIGETRTLEQRGINIDAWNNPQHVQSREAIIQTVIPFI